MPNITVYVDDATLDRLRYVREETGLSYGMVIKAALKAYD